MNKIRLSGYTFDASEKTVSHASFSDVGLNGIQLIVNVTDQIIIYNFADTSKGGTLATDTLTLEYDTTSMSDTDELMILVQTASATVGVATQPISGTVTAELSATDNAVLDNIDADLTTIIGHVDGIETLLGTIDVDTGNIATSLGSLDNAVDGNYINVNMNIAGADVSANAGTLDATTLRVTIATDDEVNNLLGTIDADTGAIKIATEAIQTALETIGGLVVNLGANNDVIVTGTVDLGATDNAVLDAIAASVAAIDTDTTTIVGHVDGIEGLLGTIDADTGNILTAVQLIDDIVYTDDTSTHATGTSKGALIMAVAAPTDTSVNANDIGSIGMTVNRELYVSLTTALPEGTNAIGKLSTNSGVDIGDVDVTSVIPGTGGTNLGKAEDAGHTTGDTGVYVLGVRNDTPNTALTNTDADYASITTDRVGGVRTALYETDFAVLGTNHVKKYYTNAGAVTDGIIWSPAAGKRWYVTDIFIQVSAAATVTLEDDLAGGDSPVWKAELAANSGWSHSFITPLFSGEDAADLIITTSAGNVYCTVVGYEV
jgi:hypothetical protein